MEKVKKVKISDKNAKKRTNRWAFTHLKALWCVKILSPFPLAKRKFRGFKTTNLSTTWVSNHTCLPMNTNRCLLLYHRQRIEFEPRWNSKQTLWLWTVAKLRARNNVTVFNNNEDTRGRKVVYFLLSPSIVGWRNYSEDEIEEERGEEMVGGNLVIKYRYQMSLREDRVWEDVYKKRINSDRENKVTEMGQREGFSSIFI